MYDEANDEYYSERPYFFWPKDVPEVEGVGAYLAHKCVADADIPSLKKFFPLFCKTTDERDPRGNTLLHVAVLSEKADEPEMLKMVRHLLAAGADPRLINRDRYTAQMYAAERGLDHLTALLSEAELERSLDATPSQPAKRMRL